MAKRSTKEKSKATPGKAPATKRRRAAQVVQLEYTENFSDGGKGRADYWPGFGALAQCFCDFPAITGKEKKTEGVRLMPEGPPDGPKELRGESRWHLICQGGPYACEADAVADARARIGAAALDDAFALPPKPGYTRAKKDAMRDIHELRTGAVGATGLYFDGPIDALKNNPLAIKALRHLYVIASDQNSCKLSFSLSDLGRLMWGRKAYPKELQSLRAALDCMCVYVRRPYTRPDGVPSVVKYALLHRLEFYTEGRQTAVNLELTPELFALNRAEIYLPRALDGLTTTADRLGNYIALKLAETTPGAAVFLSYANLLLVAGLADNRKARHTIRAAANELQSAGLFVVQNVGPEGLTFRAAGETEALLLRAAAEN